MSTPPSDVVATAFAALWQAEAGRAAVAAAPTPSARLLELSAAAVTAAEEIVITALIAAALETCIA